MPERYVALLRGINVGNNILKMERLREVFEELGFKNPRSYIQSGNIVFDAASPRKTWPDKIEGRLAGEVRLPVSVVIRSAVELKQVITSNPFLKRKGIDASKLHVTFLGGSVASSGATRLGEIKSGRDEFHFGGAHVFLHCPDGYGTSKLTNNVLERVLGMTATTRNWRTVLKMDEMMSQ
jgi:uncharacterized protein (DUF1697 family)